MARIRSQIRTNDAAFKENAAHNQQLANTLKARQQQAAWERPQRTLERQKARDKLLVRERIDAILDDGSPFLELSPLAAWGMYDGGAPSAGIVTGIGRIHGNIQGRHVHNIPVLRWGTPYESLQTDQVVRFDLRVTDHLTSRQHRCARHVARFEPFDDFGAGVIRDSCLHRL